MRRLNYADCLETARSIVILIACFVLGGKIIMYPYFSFNQNKTILVTEDDYENIGDIFEQSLKWDFNNIKTYYWLNSNNLNLW